MAIKLIRFARVTEDLYDTVPSWPLSPTPFFVEYLQYPWFSMGEKGEMLNFHQALERFQNCWEHLDQGMALSSAWFHM